MWVDGWVGEGVASPWELPPLLDACRKLATGSFYPVYSNITSHLTTQGEEGGVKEGAGLTPLMLLSDDSEDSKSACNVWFVHVVVNNTLHLILSSLHRLRASEQFCPPTMVLRADTQLVSSGGPQAPHNISPL
ncbi:hypothetical protein Pmani_026003 [Petrolisthes manimaculis]|uniref:Uncharacterized protein n=1 Tax=Petrolisthes manimaculis TaxID=1843537 RepID=A0AAE1P4C7_9EUCA|nr:hypothetical protein Pmani_026003 [Petrolisthes manimaculis]